MNSYRVFLFRQLDIVHDDQEQTVIESQKAQELFCYLLIHRQRPHSREKLSDLLWPNNSTSKAKRYLRQALWQLQTALQSEQGEAHLLTANAEWIELAHDHDLWIDVDEFESVYTDVQGVRGRNLSEDDVATLRDVIPLYRGDLLENWYQDWCILERERLQNIYLLMLDKLIGYCESTQAYEDGIIYGTKILNCDQAHERTFRRLMRLHYRAGNRTRALRLYRRCEAILRDELGVKPAERTQILYHQIQNDTLLDDSPVEDTHPHSMPAMRTPESESLKRLRLIGKSLALAQNLLEQEIYAIKNALQKRL